MGIFADRKAILKLEENLAELRDRQDDLHRTIRMLKLEWEETYDKIHRLFGRIAKRTAIDTPPLQTPEPPADPPSDAIDEISAKIHARRNAGRAA